MFGFKMEWFHFKVIFQLYSVASGMEATINKISLYSYGLGEN